MGHVFQVEWQKKHPSGCHFSFIMAKDVSIGIGKGKEALIGIFFYENKRK